MFFNTLLFQLRRAATRQVGFLFAIDSVTNLIDYAFHIYLGRVLLPADFAIVQTVNAALLVLITALGVTQPVVARFVVTDQSGPDNLGQTAAGGSVFRYYFSRSLWLGLVLSALAWWGRRPLATWLNVPPSAIGVTAIMFLLALLRPVVAGLLQGQQRFAVYGLTRLIFSFGRFAAAALLIYWGGRALGALAALPIGWTLSIVGSLAFLGLAVWRRGPPLPPGFLAQGLRLSAGAFVSYAAYMGLLNNDLIWVNRAFGSETAGAYATAVLLRRILTLLPGAVIVIMYPRAVARVIRGQAPDRLLVVTAVVITLPTLLITALYALFGRPIVHFTFGGAYEAAVPLLGWMGLAMVGYGLATIWLNFYLATRPAPYAALLAGTALLQVLLLAVYHQSLLQVTAVFAVSGWLLAVGGLLIYLGWLRPSLASGWRNGL
ncbi:MAG: oligosaccharide flippase family protein [Chloroflexota bacterium]